MECWVEHLGSKHRMVMNHLTEDVFAEFSDIIKADDLNPDKGNEIPCMACPGGDKTFMCLSNYKSHLINFHYARQLLAQDIFSDCPLCSAKLESPFGGAPLETILRHVGGEHNYFIAFANQKVVKQLREYGVYQK